MRFINPVYLARGVLLVASICLTVFIFEVALRFVWDPMDYLVPTLINDPDTGYRIEPGTAGTDDWGYRNQSVPEQVDVVALGDSMTWGHAASVSGTWPAAYARLTGQKVYNLGIGGYGPAEYLHLFETRGLALNPKRIIVGLYLGNDLADSYRSVRNYARWQPMRTASMGEFDPERKKLNHLTRAPDNPILVLRKWVRQNSLLFRSFEAGKVGQWINGWGDQREGFSGDGCTALVGERFPTLIQGDSRFRQVDPSQISVQEGAELTREFLRQLADRSHEEGVEMTVLLIPGKESVVVRPWTNVAEECEPAIRAHIAAEVTNRDELTQFLQSLDLEVIDPLTKMQEAAGEERRYRRSADSHPVDRGYELMAEALVEANLDNPRR